MEQEKQTDQTITNSRTTINESKPAGNVVVLVILILFLWPAAIIYACIRNWGTQVVTVVNNTFNEPTTNNKTSTRFSVDNKTFNNYMEAREYCKDNKIPLNKIEAEV